MRLQTFGILKKMWLILATPTESTKPNKVLDCWSCLILHNMLIRYRQQLARENDHEYRQQQMDFENLLDVVNRELLEDDDPEPSFGDDDAPDGSASDREVPEIAGNAGGSAGGLRSAHRRSTATYRRQEAVALRDRLCSDMWATRSHPPQLPLGVAV